MIKVRNSKLRFLNLSRTYQPVMFIPLTSTRNVLLSFPSELEAMHWYFPRSACPTLCTDNNPLLCWIVRSSFNFGPSIRLHVTFGGGLPLDVQSNSSFSLTERWIDVFMVESIRAVAKRNKKRPVLKDPKVYVLTNIPSFLPSFHKHL